MGNRQIKVKNLSIRYRQGPLVLKGVSFAIEHGERIGVVGRTGCGKSTLLLALMRILESETDSEIIINDKVTSNIGLRNLRSSIGMVPQNPVIFSGTVRSNLDP